MDGSVVVRYDLDDPKQVEAIKVGNVVKVKVLTSSGVDLDSRFTFLERKF